jgi:hypothetical protein
MADLTVAESRPKPEAFEATGECGLSDLAAVQVAGEEGLTIFCGGLVSNFAGKLGRDFIRPFPNGSCSRANWSMLDGPSNQPAKV